MLDSTISSKGQITIPIDIRKWLDVKPGDKVRFVKKGNDIVIEQEKKYTLEDLMNLPRTSKVKLSVKQMNQAIGDAAAAKYEHSLPKPSRRKKP